MEIKSVAIHDGAFHGDDVFSIAFLKMLYPHIKVIRTRDAELFKSVDIRVDVGGKYNHKTGDYDHHQKGYSQKRKNGIPYSGFGLIWKHFGKLLVKDWVWKYLDERLVQFIDAEDCGVELYKNSKIIPYTVYDMVDSMNPINVNNKSDFEAPFIRAVDLVSDLLKREIDRANSVSDARDKLLNLLKGRKNKQYIVLDGKIMWYEPAIKDTNLKFIIDKNSSRKDWGATAIPKVEGSYNPRVAFPKSWAGLTNNELEKVSGVKGALFCHLGRGFVATKTKEAAIEMVKIALKEK
jgi:uncharacterized UPF0160 family protein